MNRSKNLLFFLGCAAIYVGLALAFPPYFSLTQPDSNGYINFDSTRSALYPLLLRIFFKLGLDLEQITYAQLLLFAASLMILLSALQRTGLPRWLIFLFALALGANTYFSSFARTILTESLFVTVMVMTLGCLIDYLRSGQTVFLALSGLGVGIMIGIRPAGVAFLPILIIAALLKRHHRDVSIPMLVAALIAPAATGIVAERIVYRLEHGERNRSILQNLLIGRAAMLAQNDVLYSGPHADTLAALGNELYRLYAPVNVFLAGVPLCARPPFTATYEGGAQFQALNEEVSEASKRLGVNTEYLISELAIQTIAGNLSGYLRLVSIHYVGQWSVGSLTFPPTARAVNDYVAGYGPVPMQERLSEIILHPPSYPSSYVIYPAFLIAGVITLMLSFALIPFLLWPALGDDPRRYFFLLAALFSVMCQGYTIFLSLIDVSTARFLMAVYPQLCLVAIFVIWAILLRWAPGIRRIDPPKSRR